jgi:hypothetical protein
VEVPVEEEVVIAQTVEDWERRVVDLAEELGNWLEPEFIF